MLEIKRASGGAGVKKNTLDIAKNRTYKLGDFEHALLKQIAVAGGYKNATQGLRLVIKREAERLGLIA